MNQEIKIFMLAPLLATVVVVGVWVGSTIYRRYTGLTRGPSAVLWLLAVGLAIALIAHKQTEARYSGNSISEPIWFVACAVLLPMLVLPFAVRLYRQWIGGHLTEAEKQPGIDGVRAWLGVGNVICAGLIPLCVWQVFGVSILGGLALTLGLILAYPLLNLASDSARPAPAVPAEDLSSEREKVLQLLETGKISAVESAELLNALAHSAPPPPPPAAEMNPQRKLVLIGAAVLLIGFFLPWFSINPGELVNDLAAQVQQSMNGMMPPNVMPHLNLPGGTMQIHAGDVQHGLGWWILALGMVAAGLPFFATTLEAALQKKIILAALGVGVILLIYLLSDTIKYMSFGILLALAGYVLEVIGTLKERPVAC